MNRDDSSSSPVDQSVANEIKPNVMESNNNSESAVPPPLLRNDAEYARHGITMWLNNEPVKAEQFLKQRIDSTQIMTSYTFITCIVSI